MSVPSIHPSHLTALAGPHKSELHFDGDHLPNNFPVVVQETLRTALDFCSMRYGPLRRVRHEYPEATTVDPQKSHNQPQDRVSGEDGGVAEIRGELHSSDPQAGDESTPELIANGLAIPLLAADVMAQHSSTSGPANKQSNLSDGYWTAQAQLLSILQGSPNSTAADSPQDDAHGVGSEAVSNGREEGLSESMAPAPSTLPSLHRDSLVLPSPATAPAPEPAILASPEDVKSPKHASSVRSRPNSTMDARNVALTIRPGGQVRTPHYLSRGPTSGMDQCEVIPCMKMGNGLLFRLVDRRQAPTVRWAFYNDSPDYTMVVRYSLGRRSQVQAVGGSVACNPSTGRWEGELMVPSGATMVAFMGTVNGYDLQYYGIPIPAARTEKGRRSTTNHLALLHDCDHVAEAQPHGPGEEGVAYGSSYASSVSSLGEPHVCEMCGRDLRDDLNTSREVPSRREGSRHGNQPHPPPHARASDGPTTHVSQDNTTLPPIAPMTDARADSRLSTVVSRRSNQGSAPPIAPLTSSLLNQSMDEMPSQEPPLLLSNESNAKTHSSAPSRHRQDPPSSTYTSLGASPQRSRSPPGVAPVGLSATSRSSKKASTSARSRRSSVASILETSPTAVSQRSMHKVPTSLRSRSGGWDHRASGGGEASHSVARDRCNSVVSTRSNATPSIAQSLSQQPMPLHSEEVVLPTKGKSAASSRRGSRMSSRRSSVASQGSIATHHDVMPDRQPSMSQDVKSRASSSRRCSVSSEAALSAARNRCNSASSHRGSTTGSAIYPAPQSVVALHSEEVVLPNTTKSVASSRRASMMASRRSSVASNSSLGKPTSPTGSRAASFNRSSSVREAPSTMSSRGGHVSGAKSEASHSVARDRCNSVVSTRSNATPSIAQSLSQQPMPLHSEEVVLPTKGKSAASSRRGSRMSSRRSSVASQGSNTVNHAGVPYQRPSMSQDVKSWVSSSSRRCSVSSEAAPSAARDRCNSASSHRSTGSAVRSSAQRAAPQEGNGILSAKRSTTSSHRGLASRASSEDAVRQLSPPPAGAGHAPYVSRSSQLRSNRSPSRNLGDNRRASHGEDAVATEPPATSRHDRSSSSRRGRPAALAKAPSTTTNNGDGVLASPWGKPPPYSTAVIGEDRDKVSPCPWKHEPKPPAHPRPHKHSTEDEDAPRRRQSARHHPAPSSAHSVGADPFDPQSVAYQYGRPTFHGDFAEPCFEVDNGLLFRLTNSATGQWAFYNDTTTYMMHVRFSLGPRSVVTALGQTVIHRCPATGEWQGDLIIHPGCTTMAFAGIVKGYRLRYFSLPIESVA